MSKRSTTEANDHRLDQLSMDAPILPTHRPPTKREVWARFHFIYKDIKDEAGLRRFARDWWCWSYVDFVNRKGWRKQPDWTDGEPVIHEAIPQEPFGPDEGAWIREVTRLYEIATRSKRIAA